MLNEKRITTIRTEEGVSLLVDGNVKVANGSEQVIDNIIDSLIYDTCNFSECEEIAEQILVEVN